MELKDTIKLMESKDYKERFKAEYYQTKIRWEKLGDLIHEYNCGTLNFKPKCSLVLLLSQYNTMGIYLNLLKMRAVLEEVDLNETPNGKAD